MLFKYFNMRVNYCIIMTFLMSNIRNFSFKFILIYLRLVSDKKSIIHEKIVLKKSTKELNIKKKKKIIMAGHNSKHFNYIQSVDITETWTCAFTIYSSKIPWSNKRLPLKRAFLTIYESDVYRFDNNICLKVYHNHILPSIL